MCKQHILNTSLYKLRLIHKLCSFKIHHCSENKNCGYHTLRKAFSKFYRRHFDIVSKCNVGLKTLLQGLSDPEFYGDLVYKFRKLIGKNDYPYHFKKIIVRYNKSAAGIARCPATALTSSEVTVLNLCTSSSHALYCTKFWEIIWNDIKVIEWT